MLVEDSGFLIGSHAEFGYELFQCDVPGSPCRCVSSIHENTRKITTTGIELRGACTQSTHYSYLEHGTTVNMQARKVFSSEVKKHTVWFMIVRCVCNNCVQLSILSCIHGTSRRGMCLLPGHIKPPRLPHSGDWLDDSTTLSKQCLCLMSSCADNLNVCSDRIRKEGEEVA